MQPGLVTVTRLVILMALQPLGNPLAAYQASGKKLLFEGDGELFPKTPGDVSAEPPSVGDPPKPSLCRRASSANR